MRWWPAWAALALDGGAAAIALDVHLDDGGVVDEAVDRRQGHGLVGEHLAPFAERLIGGDQQRTPFVTHAYELEQHAGLGLIFADVGDVVEDQQMMLVELGQRAFEDELAPRSSS